MPKINPPGLEGPRFPRYAAGVLLLAVAGVLLRAYGIAARSFWFDEAFSWRIITLPWPEMIEGVARDNHPPLYFILLKAWAVGFGTSEVALRFLSALFGGGTVIAAAATAREIVRARGGALERSHAAQAAGLIAASLVAVSVVQIRWAWEVRMYSLGTALAAATSWAMLRALRTQTAGAWVGYGVLALLFAYTHYYALFSLLAQAIYVAGSIFLAARWRPGRAVASRAFWHALLAAAIVAVGWLPWLPVFIAQRRQVKANYWTTPVRVEDVTRGMYRLFVVPENGPIGAEEAWVATAFAASALFALLACRPRRGELYLALAAALPVVLPVVLSRLGTDVFHPRYLLFGHVHLLIGVGVLLGRVRDLRPQVVAAALLVANGLAIDIHFWHHMELFDKPGMRAAMAMVNAERRPGEPIVVSMSLLHSPTLYYVEDKRNVHLYDNGMPVLHYLGAPALRPGEMANDRALTRYRQGRVWAVEMRGGGWGSYQVPELAGWKWIAEYSFPEVYDVQGEVVISLYEVTARAGRG